jgi:hypothetical protein
MVNFETEIEVVPLNFGFYTLVSIDRHLQYYAVMPSFIPSLIFLEDTQ